MKAQKQVKKTQKKAQKPLDGQMAVNENRFLSGSCDIFVARLTEDERRKACSFFDDGASISTACSGTDTPVMCHNAIARSLGVEKEPHHAWSCEKVKWKADFCVADSSNKSLPVWDDINKLEKGHTTGLIDSRSDHRLPVEATKVHTCCCCCHNVSTLKTDRSCEKDAVNATGHGTTGETLDALLRHIAVSRPLVCIMENVPGFVKGEMVSEADENKALLENGPALKLKFNNIGYEIDWRRVGALRIPVTRGRVFPVAIDILQRPDASIVLNSAWTTLERLKRIWTLGH